MGLALPQTYLLPTHLSFEALHELEDQIPTLTNDISEAKLIIGKVTTKQRALFELRSRKLWTEEVSREPTRIDGGVIAGDAEKYTPPRKRRRTEDMKVKEIITVDSSTESEAETDTTFEDAATHLSEKSTSSHGSNSFPTAIMSSPVAPDSPLSVATRVRQQSESKWGDTIKVVKLAWLEDCLAAGHLLPFGSNLVYEGTPVQRSEDMSEEPHTRAEVPRRKHSPKQILSRARADSPQAALRPFSKGRNSRGRSQIPQHAVTRPTHLLHQTTSEHESPEKLPPLPDYLHTTYSCQRPTPLNPPNDSFITLLKKIRTARILGGDEIGVRAYSTSIAAIAAYPSTLATPQEVLRLPGCDQKIAHLFQEYKDTGHIAAVDELDSDPKLKVLYLFYEIWGVGAATARDFYRKGWRDLDDIVEYGWSTLTRVQQIGVKYYDEFQIKIPRAEVEAISSIILFSANKIHPGFQMTIVGGYRRGKTECGDVDVILSHPNESATYGFIQDIVSELERGNWITHTLLLSMANSERGQTPVSWKGEGRKLGSGFDTLDKALLVWQDPHWPSQYEDLEKNPKAKNPNVHRRVDIIISPWKTVGCAVAGWTSGTTFQRDLRRYVKKEKNLKFDSSGIRSRLDGRWVDLESIGGKAPDMLTAEKRVFKGLALEWREPDQRCTG